MLFPCRPKVEPMTTTDHPFKSITAALAASLVLTACGIGGPYPGVPELLPASTLPVYQGAVAPPQVTYRIDENRYFEYVPRGPGACTDAMVYYNDKKLGIHSAVVRLDRAVAGANDFIIDASNDEFLIGPMTRGNTDCSSGGGGCGGDSMPYSTDAGRTWKRAWAQRPYAAVGVSGNLAYSGGGSDLLTTLDLRASDIRTSEWTYRANVRFLPVAMPMDKKFHCTTNGKE
jgi:hypothetical protein